jgi:hypothetical protein
MAKQPEPRMTRTTRRLAGRDFEAFSDGVLQDPVTGHVERLTWGVTPKSRYDAAAFARSLFSRDENPLVYVDTSLFDARTSPRLWEALLSRPRGMTIIPIIRKELEPWLRSTPSMSRPELSALETSPWTYASTIRGVLRRPSRSNIMAIVYLNKGPQWTAFRVCRETLSRVRW